MRSSVIRVLRTAHLTYTSLWNVVTHGDSVELLEYSKAADPSMRTSIRSRTHASIRVLSSSSLVAVVLIATFAASATTSPTQIAASDRTLVLRERAGPYRYWRTLRTGAAFQQAVRSFGFPNARGRDSPQSNVCTARWERVGIDIDFAGVPNCTSLERGVWYGLRLWGPMWRTSRGLRIGDRATEITKRYPRARYVSRPPRPGVWWLVTERQLEFGLKPLLIAEVGAGRVVGLDVPAGYVF
jgi:hypothetical protein